MRGSSENGVHQDLPRGLENDIAKFCETFPKIIDDLESLLTDNRIFKQRNVDIGVVSAIVPYPFVKLSKAGADELFVTNDKVRSSTSA